MIIFELSDGQEFETSLFDLEDRMSFELMSGAEFNDLNSFVDFVISCANKEGIQGNELVKKSNILDLIEPEEFWQKRCCQK